MNQKEWELLNREERHHTKYPAEEVIRFLKGKISKGGRVFDAGCGAGRHVKLMGDEGYIPYGMDYSSSGVNKTKELLITSGHKEYCDNITQGSLEKLPFVENFFDGVISYGVLYYMEKNLISEAINEMFRVLKPGGKILLHIRTLGDYRFDRTNITENDEHGCMIVENSTDRSSVKENGMFMHFFDKDEVMALMSNFDDVVIDTEYRGHDGDAFRDENFLVSAYKPCN